MKFVQKMVHLSIVKSPLSGSGRLLMSFVLGAGAITFGAFSSRTEAQQPIPQPSNSPAVARLTEVPGDDLRYRIGPGDVLTILVRKAAELSGPVRVDQRGMIRIPMVEGEVRAACLTESELAAQIRTLYLEFKRDPNVEVFVSDFQSRPVSIIGAINSPGQFRLQRQVRLLELLSLAGGPAARAGRTIDIVHTGPPSLCQNSATEKTADVVDQISMYRLSEVLTGKLDANPFVQPGDIIQIPDAEQVFVIGHVVQPQAIPLRDKTITISRAMAMVGGLARDGKSDHIRIVRQTSAGAPRQEIYVDLKAIQKFKAEDIALLPNDIVEVPASTGKTILGLFSGAIGPTISGTAVRAIPGVP